MITGTNFGGSIGQLASIRSAEQMAAVQQELQQEVERRRTAQYMQSFMAQRNDAKLAQENLLRDDALRREQFDFSRGQADINHANQIRDFNQREQYQNWQMTRPSPSVESARINAEGRQLQEIYADQASLAEMGEGEDNPALSPAQNSVIGRIREGARARISGKIAEAEGVSGLLNREQQLKNYIALSGEAKKTAPKESIGALDRAISWPGRAAEWAIDQAGAPKWVNNFPKVAWWPFAAAQATGFADVPARPARVENGVSYGAEQTQEDIAGDVSDWRNELTAISPLTQKSAAGQPFRPVQDQTGQWRVSSVPSWYGVGTNTATNAPAGAAPAPMTVPTVVRKTQDGRLAIFDANTKQFLKYADQ